jgi:hypothetical protein
VELGQPVPPSLPGASTTSTLPPRVGGEGEVTRRKLPSRRVKRPIGGYLPFEKSRSWIGMMALFVVIFVGGGAAYLYCSKINEIQRTTGRSGGSTNIWKAHDDALRKEYLEKQKKAMARLKAKNIK